MLRVFVCCRSLVLYSLCHTEYWLGGRWLNGSCLALLVLFIFSYFYFYFTLIFLFASRGHSVALFALLHTANPLTSADNVNCLPPPTRCTSHCFSLSLLLFVCKRSCVFITWQCVGRLCMGATVCDTNDKSLSECITCTIRTLPVLIFCLSVRTHSSTDTVCCHISSHLISSSTTGLDFSVFTWRVFVSLL